MVPLGSGQADHRGRTQLHCDVTWGQQNGNAFVVARYRFNFLDLIDNHVVEVIRNFAWWSRGDLLGRGKLESGLANFDHK